MNVNLSNLYKVNAVNPDGNGGEWISLWLNTDAVEYVQPLTDGDFKSHFVIGFHNREYIIKAEDIHTVFEI
jgi:hypothetical protein